MLKLNSKFILNCKNVQKCEAKLLEVVNKHPNFKYSDINEYHKGGFEIKGQFVINETAWEIVTYKAIVIALSFGQITSLTGDIQSEVDLVISQPKQNFIEFINFHIERERDF